MKNIHILGGGTFSHVRNHLSLATPAFGQTAKIIFNQLCSMVDPAIYYPKLTLTKMADSYSELVTNYDVEAYVDKLIADPQTKCIIFNMALCDFNGQIDNIQSGKFSARLKTADGITQMNLVPSDKIIGRIRSERKDIFVVGFKTTCGSSPDEQYMRGMDLLKTNSLNLVLANDTQTRMNMIIAPEETRYCQTTNRAEALGMLCRMATSRMQNDFTRSTVVAGNAVQWDSPAIPQNLREVVDFCIDNGAYKPFRGKTAGHFAVKVDDSTFLTSIRKSNFNDLKKTGLVKIESSGKDAVIAHGFKPSVGGQSQRIIFGEHPDVDCIVHFHAPLKTNGIVPCTPQWPNECGSHQCGQNTSDHIKKIEIDGHYLSVVYLEDHGPNIVFNRNVPSAIVTKFIIDTFDLSMKTGGLIGDNYAN